MDMELFNALAKELLIDNVKRIEGCYITPYWVTPLNILHGQKLLLAKAQDEKDVEREVHASLVEVVAAMDRDKGINEAAYEANKYGINSLARDLTEQRWWALGSSNEMCIRADREGRKAAVEQVARFPTDHVPDDMPHTNIFDTGARGSNFEGTVFQTEYGSDGNLTLFRIFHQGHRDMLKITTVDVPVLAARIKEFVASYTDMVRVTHPGLTLNAAAYRQKMDQFNQAFGDCVRLGEMQEASQRSMLTATFVQDNPSQLADKMVQYGKMEGLLFRKVMGTVTHTVWDDTLTGETGDHSRYVDLYLERHLRESWGAKPFDSIMDADKPTVILPYLNQGLPSN